LAIRVSDAASSAKKFAQRAAGAAPDYQAGVQDAGQTWSQNTQAAADTYASGVQDAIGRGAFARGVQQAGSARYQDRASGVGARRYPEGVRDAAPRWEQATAPYLQVIAGLTLTPRRPKGDPANFQRVEQVGQALRRKKVGG